LPGRGPGTSGKSSGSFSLSAPSARFSTIRLSSSCSISSNVGILHGAAISRRLFVESLMTQTLINPRHSHNKIPSFRAGHWALTATTLFNHGLLDVATYSPWLLHWASRTAELLLANPDAHAARLYGPDANYKMCCCECDGYKPRYRRRTEEFPDSGSPIEKPYR